ncbi:MAG: hypothetical protein NZ937_09365 [Armatimonadetes bacterium]|nr:hypothetical protein [Armatimonadota bacterium]
MKENSVVLYERRTLKKLPSGVNPDATKIIVASPLVSDSCSKKFVGAILGSGYFKPNFGKPVGVPYEMTENS